MLEYNKKILLIAIFMLFVFCNKQIAHAEPEIEFKSNIQAAVDLSLKGNAKAAEKILLREIEKKPENIAAMLELAKLYIAMQRFNDAINIINKAFAIEPDNPLTYIITATLFYKNNQLDEAEDLLNKYISANPYDAEAMVLFGKVYLKKAEAADPTDEVQKEDLLQKSFKFFNQAAKEDFNLSDAHVGMAKVYIRMGDLSAAHNEFLRAGELKSDTPEALFAIGKFYERIGRYQKALKFIDKSIAVNPVKTAEAYSSLGIIYEKLGDFNQATMNYSMALGINAEDTFSKKRLKDLQAKEKKKYKAASKKKNNITAQINMLEPEDRYISQLVKADYYLIMDRFTEARRLYLSILEMQPNHIGAISGLIEMYYAQWYEDQLMMKNFVLEKQYFTPDNPSKRLIVPFLKLNFILEKEIDEEVKNNLKTFIYKPGKDYQDYINSIRIFYLLRDIESFKSELNVLLSYKLSNYQKFNLAKNIYYDRNYDQAESILKSLLKTNYSSITETILRKISAKKNRVASQVEQGIYLYKVKKYDKAILKFKNAIKLHYVNKKARLYLAYSHEKLKQYDKAVQELELYIKLEKLFPSEPPEVDKLKIEKILTKWKTTNSKLNFRFF